MNCERTVELLSAYSEGELRAEQHQEVRLHLEACPECDRTRRQLEKTWQLLGAWDELTPSPTLQAAVWERIRTEAPAPGWRWGWSWLTRGGFAAAALGLILVGGLYLRQPAPTKAPPVAAVVTVDQEMAALVPQWDLEPAAELPETLDAPVIASHLEPLQLGQLSDDSWLDEAHEALDQELGDS